MSVGPKPAARNVSKLPELPVEGYRLAATSPSVSPLFQGRVVELAREVELGFEREPLVHRGVNPVPVGPLEPRVLSHHFAML